MVASPVPIVFGVEETAPSFDLLERGAQDFLGPHAGLGGEQRGELRWAFAGKHLREQRRVCEPARHDCLAQDRELVDGKTFAHRELRCCQLGSSEYSVSPTLSSNGTLAEVSRPCRRPFANASNVSIAPPI